jgi:hypothetical protein
MAHAPQTGDGTPAQTQGPGGRRFVDTDEARHPEEIADPTTFEDDSGRDWTAYVKDNWPYFFIGLPIAFGIFVLAFSQVLRTIPEILASRRVQLVLGAGILATTCLLYGVKYHRSAIKDLEELTLKKDDNEPGVYYGEFIPGNKSIPDRFTPMKSFGLLGNKKRPYTIEELSPALADRWAGKDPDNSRDDPAHIWLHRAFLGTEPTDLGLKVVQATGGLEVDEFGDTAVIRATPPEQGSPEQINEYESIISSAHSEVAHLREKNQRFIRQMKELREMDNVAVDDAIDQVIGYYERIEEARGYGPRRSTDDESTGGFVWDDSEQPAFANNDD